MSLPPWRSGSSAFTAVPAKHKLNRQNGAQGNSQHQKNTQENAQGAGSQWPDSLKQFVARCFSMATPEERPVMEAQLRNEITRAFENKTTWVENWDSKTLPIFAERLNPRKPPQPAVAKNKNGNSKKKQKRVHGPETEISELASSDKIEQRMKRFKDKGTSPAPASASALVPTGEPLVGRSTRLEKGYLRLTSAPDPDSVRPLHILTQTLELLKKKWREEQNYAYICDQFKSLRQDLTVQHIETEFTVKVYEIHARIALEKGDMGEYNQCQSRLKQLYESGIPGHDKEFLSYRLLYLLHTQNRTEVGQILLNLKEDEWQDENVKHALEVNEALTNQDFYTLFKLYASAPNMAGYLMDQFIDRMRLMAVATLCRAVRPEISLEFLTKVIRFDTLEDTLMFLHNHKVGQYITEKGNLQSKEAYVILETARQEAFRKIDIKGQI